jgi:DNA-directed RNA polymerase subunit beta'
VDVAQDVIISEPDCGTLRGISSTAIVEGGEEIESLRDRIVGRTALDDVIDPVEGRVIVETGAEIDEDIAAEIQRSGVQRVRIRSVLTCESRRGVCIKCYGRNLATGKAVDIGEAVGVIAAQSIGEPGTQLTMRRSTSAARRVSKSLPSTKRAPTARFTTWNSRPSRTARARSSP